MNVEIHKKHHYQCAAFTATSPVSYVMAPTCLTQRALKRLQLESMDIQGLLRLSNPPKTPSSNDVML